MPRGVYDRKSSGAATAVAPAQESKTNGNGTKKLATEVLEHVNSIATTIKQEHSRIGNTVLDIGKNFFAIKHLLDAVPTDVRRDNGVPTFTSWMAVSATQLCGMSERTAWHYYRNYSEAIASGLKPETITALAPTILKNEKPRKAVMTAIQHRPELAQQLNEAAGKPAQLRRIAASEEVKEILKQAEKTPRTAAERVETSIVSAYKSVLLAEREEFQPALANQAISELASAIRNAATQLKIETHLNVTFTEMTSAEIEARFAVQETAVEDLPIPTTMKELVARLGQLAEGGAVRVQQVGR